MPSWAILGKAGTFHLSHVHSKGWYSGTCYVEVPQTIDEASDAGYLTIGEPPFSVKDALPPLAVIKPDVGKMILFLLWHSTRPFAGRRRQVGPFSSARQISLFHAGDAGGAGPYIGSSDAAADCPRYRSSQAQSDK